MKKKKQRRKTTGSRSKTVNSNKLRHWGRDHEDKWKQQDVGTICVDRRGIFVVI